MTEPRKLKSGIVNVTFGEGCTIVEPCNLYGCSVGDGSFVGPFVEIQKQVTIGKRARIQSHAFICELVTIGDKVSIGTNATILPVTICDNVVVGAGSVVTRDITVPGIYAGNPARLIRKL